MACYRVPDDILRDYPPQDWYVQCGDTPEDGWGKIQDEAERLGLIRHGQIGQADCRLFKARPVVGLYETQITERLGLQIRGELFNILNHPNFSNPSGLLNDFNFGKSTSTIGNLVGLGTSRQTQLAIKFIF